jgi:hypothetical protein
MADGGGAERRLAGRVTASDGQPLGGSAVFIVSAIDVLADSSPARRRIDLTRAADDGSFVMSALSGAPVSLIATAYGYAPSAWAGVPLEGREISLVLQPAESGSLGGGCETEAFGTSLRPTELQAPQDLPAEHSQPTMMEKARALGPSDQEIRRRLVRPVICAMPNASPLLALEPEGPSDNKAETTVLYGSFLEAGVGGLTGLRLVALTADDEPVSEAVTNGDGSFLITLAGDYTCVKLLTFWPPADATPVVLPVVPTGPRFDLGEVWLHSKDGGVEP